MAEGPTFRRGSEEKKGAHALCPGPVGRNPSTQKQLWHLSPGELENWYKDNIDSKTDGFRTSCRAIIRDVVKDIQKRTATSNSHNDHSFTFDVDTVVEGGSFAKGTMVEGLSDVDLVLVDNNAYLQPIAEIGKEKYKTDLSKIIDNLVLILSAERQGYLVKCKKEVGDRLVEFNVLPTTEENFRHFRRTYRNMFESMRDVGTDDVGRETREFYYASFVEHQVRFVKNQPGHVKKLIRLVKYWASSSLPDKLQKSYPLELITIDQWKKAREPKSLDKAKGLRSVLEVLTNLDRLCVYWNFMDGVDDNFNKSIIKKLNMKRPIILDPANPTNNVGDLYQKNDNKEVIKAAAEKTLQTDLLSDVSAWQNV